MSQALIHQKLPNKVWKFIFFLGLAVLMLEEAQGKDTSICNIAKSAIGEASTIRGLKHKKKVPCLVHDREQVKEYLLDAINTKITPQKLNMEELLYRALGFIPEDFEYKEGIIDLYLSQLGGYYDPEKQHFVMAGWMPAMLQNTIAVHELTHALQDQHYQLDTFLDYKGFSSDQLLARSALIEGDATAVMMDYTRRLTGQKPIATDKNVESIMMQNLVSGAMVAGFSEIPKSLRNMLLFPYTSGLRFAHSLLVEDGYKSIDRAFLSPPDTTEQILHPEKYAQKSTEEYKEIPVEELASALNLQPDALLYEDSFGEFGISVLLEMHVPTKKAAKAAAGWGGDRIAVFPASNSKEKLMAWKTNWDSEKDADEFFGVFVEALNARYPEGEVTATKATWAKETDKWQIDLKREGNYVTWIRTPKASG